MKSDSYFLGGSSPDGFVSSIDEIFSDTRNTVFILKGTPGSGKSSFMKSISQAFKESPQEIFHCSSDPDSYDGVYIKDRQVFIMDGTAPHCKDPVYPKAVQSVIDLGSFLDSARLREQKSEIIRVTDKCSACHGRCRLCLTAASSVLADVYNAAIAALDRKHLAAFMLRTAKRLIPKKESGGQRGVLITRQLSAITPDGYKTYIPQCQNICLLCDDTFAVSSAVLDYLAENAAAKGYDVIVSRCLVTPERRTEHIIIPELDMAFLTSSCVGRLEKEKDWRIINTKRFIPPTDDDIKRRLKLGRKAVSVIMDEAAGELANAKRIHDRLEEFYTENADFDSVTRAAYRLISEIKSLG